MKKYIDNVRQRPEKERESILAIVTVLSMVIIAGLWVASLPGRFGAVAKEADTEALAPFDALKASVGDSYDSVFREGN